ncbi:MAG: hypothetical protein AAF763_16890 [Pseudomonadota bacterium]
MKFQVLAAVAALAISSTAAYAVTTSGNLTYTPDSSAPHALQVFSLTDGGAASAGPIGADNSLSDDTVLIGELGSSTGSLAAGSVVFKFTAAEDGLFTTNFSTVSPLSGFSGLEIAWLEDDESTVISSLTSDFNTTELLTTFATAGEMQFLRASWTGFRAASNLDFRIEAAIPVPAGVLLLGTAFVVAGAARRVSRKAA